MNLIDVSIVKMIQFTYLKFSSTNNRGNLISLIRQILVLLINNLFLTILMLKATILALILIAASSASVPCTQYQSSKLGTASNCTINRDGPKSISWSAQINFNADYKWTDSSASNVLADMGSPRLPISPSSSKCQTKAGSYTKGQSVTFSCSQAFDQIPTGYANVISAFDGADYPLGFSMKVPLSSILTQE